MALGSIARATRGQESRLSSTGRRLGPLAAGLALATTTLTPTACGGSGTTSGPRPASALARSTDSAIAFATLRNDWAAREHLPPALMRALVDSYLAQYGYDDRARIARVYSAVLRMDAGDYAGAEFDLARASTNPPGATSDFVNVARARLLRHRGRSQEAYDLLQPLAGKLVDDDANALFYEQLVFAAVESRRAFEAIAYMDTWLKHGTQSARELAMKRIPLSLAKIPPDVLLRSLESMRSNPKARFNLELRALIATRLAHVAIEKGDKDLAHWLVDPRAGRSVMRGDTGIILNELASRRHGIHAVDGHTIGLVLPTGLADTRDVAADATRGAAWALGITQDRKVDGPRPRLVTRDDSGNREALDNVLDAIAGDGAVAIIAGFDPIEAEHALGWAERARIPVIALSPPRPTATVGAYGFIAGASTRAGLEALRTRLEKERVRSAAVIASDTLLDDVGHALSGGKVQIWQPVSCDIPRDRAGEPRFPLQAWRRGDVRTFIVAGSDACGRDVIREVESVRNATVALALEATGFVGDTDDVRVLAVGAGAMPHLEKTQVLRERKNPTEIDTFAIRLGAPPTWYAALGRDAALLARRAIRTLPGDRTTKPEEVRKRRDAARDALLKVRANLWTTNASGFTPDHHLPRTLHIYDSRTHNKTTP